MPWSNTAERTRLRSWSGPAAVPSQQAGHSGSVVRARMSVTVPMCEVATDQKFWGTCRRLCYVIEP
jgi:hypothetical protein